VAGLWQPWSGAKGSLHRYYSNAIRLAPSRVDHVSLANKKGEGGLWKISNKSDLISHYMVEFWILVHRVLFQRLDRWSKDQD
jgi:hypothetical protein